MQNGNATTETIGPKQASEMLETLVEGQRHLRESHVERLAQDMAEGKFRLSNDAIVLVNNRLANGQHRLQAIIRYGKAVPLLVLRTSDNKLFDVLDTGIKRTTADALCQYGITYARQIAATVVWIVRYDKKICTAFGVSDKNNLVTRTALVDYALKNKELLQQEAAFIKSLYDQHRIISPALAAAFYHIVARNHKRNAVQFTADLFVGPLEQNAIYDLRERLIKNLTQHAKMSTYHIFSLLFKAFRSFLNGTRPGTLKISIGEDFPYLT